MSFQDLLKDRIRVEGPLDIGRFMSLVVSHYYSTRDPFGEKGDFTTAPEISQMFGEMIGAWAAQVWIDMGKPSRVTLLELGPGRGTLMADLLRATAKVPGFHAALDIVMLEISPVLREKQALALSRHCEAQESRSNPEGVRDWIASSALPPRNDGVKWIEKLQDVSSNAPLIILANEFLDALPVHHIQYNGEWRERAVGLQGDGFGFTHKPVSPELLALIPNDLPEPNAGDIYELSPERLSFVKDTLSLLKQCTGAALFIDYGYTKPAYGESLQALYKHQYCPVLENVGEADLTAHVDFRGVERAAKAAGVDVFGPVTQAQFLLNLGIDVRAQALIKASPPHTKDIEKALRRLTHSDEMGTLFKTIGLSYGLKYGLCGF